jgi:ribose 5-phosphate isomerase B
MRVAVGFDHGGFPLKGRIIDELRAAGHDVIDLGTHSEEPVDYPDFAAAVGRAVQSGQAERGIVVCGSGVGASIAANKIRGVRASIAHDVYSAHQGVEHDDMNVLTLGARVVGPELAIELVRAFVNARFSGEERHARRLAKVNALDARADGVKEASDAKSTA